ncbi:hypothetical protein, partial [Candidatus Protofrankia californiensis]|uniref:hypothetical protein n=1 Tax=Candidatus Protofrankia californiensis TaxID=1839754 RepID=UPI0019D09B3D
MSVEEVVGMEERGPCEACRREPGCPAAAGRSNVLLSDDLGADGAHHDQEHDHDSTHPSAARTMFATSSRRPG